MQTIWILLFIILINILPYFIEYKCPFCRDIVDICCNEEEYYEWPGYDEDVVYINEN